MPRVPPQATPSPAGPPRASCRGGVSAGQGVADREPPRANILGVRVSAVNMGAVLAAFEAWIGQRQRQYVCVTPAHSIMDCRNDPALRRIFNHAGLTTPDGMAIVWLLRLQGHRHVERVYGPDLLLATCQRSLVTGWRHFFCGGAAGVADELAQRLGQRFPGLAVVGTASPPFHPPSFAEEEQLMATINAARPDIVWVGLGSPKQERWMACHRECLEAPVLVGVGAAFDFLSGRKRQAPRWVQRAGCEWLFRWGSEPRRLSGRYRRYPLFALLAAAQLLRLRHFPSD
jgi:N-acetylglucosaminyldiphosphoundecaprenol N-acetyl-beta-D-mannosaminyltransferase